MDTIVNDVEVKKKRSWVVVVSVGLNKLSFLLWTLDQVTSPLSILVVFGSDLLQCRGYFYCGLFLILRYSIEANRLMKIPVDYSELINEASLFT